MQVCLYFVYLAVVAFVASYAEVGLWMWTGVLHPRSAVAVEVYLNDLHAQRLSQTSCCMSLHFMAGTAAYCASPKIRHCASDL